MKQQILPLKLPQEKSFQNFFGSANQVIISALKSLSAPSIYLWGNNGAGVTHLLQASCQYWQQQGWYVLYLDLTQKPHLSTLLQGALEGIQLLAIDHLDAAIHEHATAENVFHVFNRGIATPFQMIFGAHFPPENLHCPLKDLSSRLNASLIFHVQYLNDMEKKAALIAFAEQRGLELSNDVAEFMLGHFPRELSTLLQILEKLDLASLREQRRLTIPFLKTCIFHQHPIC